MPLIYDLKLISCLIYQEFVKISINSTNSRGEFELSRGWRLEHVIKCSALIGHASEVAGIHNSLEILIHSSSCLLQGRKRTLCLQWPLQLSGRASGSHTALNSSWFHLETHWNRGNHLSPKILSWDSAPQLLCCNMSAFTFGGLTIHQDSEVENTQNPAMKKHKGIEIQSKMAGTKRTALGTITNTTRIQPSRAAKVRLWEAMLA